MSLSHPRGLYVLFFTELWERFSYYGMRAILIFYLTRHFLFDDEAAYLLYGSYVSLIYALPVIGGLVADRWLGARKAVTLGAVLLVLGHGAMAFEGSGARRVVEDGRQLLIRDGVAEQVMFLALALICVGVGFLKANISTLVGSLYAPDDDRRDSAFTLFYMGINLGAFSASLLVGWLGETLGWAWGFGAAGIGMSIGLAIFLGGQKHLAGAAEPPDPAALARPRMLGLSAEWLIRIGALLAVILVWQMIQFAPLVGGLLGLVAALGVGGALAYALLRLPAVERDRMLLMLGLIAFSVVFWSLFEQAGSSLNLFTDRNVDRVLFGTEVPASQFQALNAGFIILLAPLFAMLWPWLARRRREPTTPTKFALAIIQAGLGFGALVMGAASADDGLVAVGWLVLAYFLHTTGELCLSPVGLAMVTRLSVPQVVGMMMGIWFLSIAGAGYLGGLIATTMGVSGGEASSADASLAIYADVFGRLAWIAVAAGAALLVLSPWLRRFMHRDVAIADRRAGPLLEEAR
ncbi:MAG TPA: peptide MFS transporter [Pseudomonadales bacterium]|nr:peptide MFS transporter [Pseudomonadales bacterium]